MKEGKTCSSCWGSNKYLQDFNMKMSHMGDWGIVGRTVINLILVKQTVKTWAILKWLSI
jgi:hypothetical protein